MARQPRVFNPAYTYHLYGRGVRGQEIFRSPEDCEFFMNKIEEYISIFDVRFLNYTPMPNHYHFEVRDPFGTLSEFMHRLLTAYVSYFNRRYRQTGHLFERRFNSKACRDDRYALALARYIDLNPVRAGIVRTPGEWKWSGWNEVFGYSSRKIISLHDREKILGSTERYRAFVGEKISLARSVKREVPGMFNLEGQPSSFSEEVLTRLTHEKIKPRGILFNEICNNRSRPMSALRASIAKAAYAEGVAQAEIALFFGCSRAAVQRQLKRRGA